MDPYWQKVIQDIEEKNILRAKALMEQRFAAHKKRVLFARIRERNRKKVKEPVGL